MEKFEFATRLSQLRVQKQRSARDISLELGQNSGYINNIENGKSLPSMSMFFSICECLEINPADFFDLEISNPQKLNELVSYLKQLDDKKLENITSIVKEMIK